MRSLIFFGLLLFVFPAAAQPKATPVTRASLPAGLAYPGQYLDGLDWTDAGGRHLVIRTEASKPTDSGVLAELFAFHYLLQDGKVHPTWKVYDLVPGCEVDWICRFIRPSFQVTDLDKDGQAEVWLMYRTGCFGDVGPTTQKIIMYEGDKKYALRGETRAVLGGQDFGGGKYRLDPALSAAPAAVRNFAKALWKKYELEFGQKKAWLGMDD